MMIITVTEKIMIKGMLIHQHRQYYRNIDKIQGIAITMGTNDMSENDYVINSNIYMHI